MALQVETKRSFNQVVTLRPEEKAMTSPPHTLFPLPAGAAFAFWCSWIRLDITLL